MHFDGVDQFPNYHGTFCESLVIVKPHTLWTTAATTTTTTPTIKAEKENWM